MKPANFAPWYAALYPEFAEIARKHGYALAVHGSMARDFDVVAIPWREDVSTPREVIDDIIANFAIKEFGEPTNKNHGRVAYSLSIGFGYCFADLSFMPTRAESHHDLIEALRHVTACLVDELGNLADENEVADEDLAAVLGIDYARQIIAARLRIRQARAILTKEAGHG